MSAISPNGKRTATITAPIAKKMTIIRVEPWRCGGSPSGCFPERYRKIDHRSIPSTPMNTRAASDRMM